MSDVDDIVTGTITADSSTPTRQAFNALICMAYHTHNTDPWRDYGGLKEMLDDGFTSKEPAYRMVASAFKQSPRLKKVRVGRITTAVAHSFDLTITDATEGNHIKLTITGPDGTATNIDYTIPAAATTTTVATAVELLVDAVTGLTSTSATAVISVTGDNAGEIFYVSGLTGCTYKDTTVSAGVDTDLTNCLADDENFYGVASAVESKANIDEIAAWCETNGRFFVAHSQDDGELGGSGPIITALVGATYANTFPLWSRDTIDYPAAGFLGMYLPKNPGSATANLKSIVGVQPDKLTSTQKTNLETSGWNYYTTILGRNVTRPHGKVASGQYADVVLGIAWINATIKTNVFDLLADEDKEDYTDVGISKVCGVMRAVLSQAASDAYKILDPGNGDDVLPPFVDQPKVSEIDPADRANRLLPDIPFGGRLRGGIDQVTYRGTLSI